MMNSGERNIFFNFPGYYGHGVPANYCYTNESRLVQNNSKNKEAKKEEPKQEAMREKSSTKETQVFVSVWKENYDLTKLLMYGDRYQQRYLRLVMKNL